MNFTKMSILELEEAWRLEERLLHKAKYMNVTIMYMEQMTKMALAIEEKSITRTKEIDRQLDNLFKNMGLIDDIIGE